MPPAEQPPRVPRWHRRPAVRPQEILEAAFRVFGTRGLHRATLEDVAREAGISKGTIYLYFPSKAALFTAMLKSRVNDIMPPLAPGRDGGGLLGDQLAAIGKRLYDFFRSPAFLAMYRTVVGEAREFPEAAALLYREGILPANRRLAELIRRGIAAGEFRAVDPLIAARALVGMLQVFAVSQELLGGRRILPLADARILRTVTDVFFRGLLAAPPSPPPHRPVRGAR